MGHIAFCVFELKCYTKNRSVWQSIFSIGAQWWHVLYGRHPEHTACLFTRSRSQFGLTCPTSQDDPGLPRSRILQDSPPHAYLLLLGPITRNPSFSRKKLHRCRSSHHPLTDNQVTNLVSSASLFFTGFLGTQQAAITSSYHRRLSTRRYRKEQWRRNSIGKCQPQVNTKVNVRQCVWCFATEHILLIFRRLIALPPSHRIATNSSNQGHDQRTEILCKYLVCYLICTFLSSTSTGKFKRHHFVPANGHLSWNSATRHSKQVLFCSKIKCSKFCQHFLIFVLNLLFFLYFWFFLYY